MTLSYTQTGSMENVFNLDAEDWEAEIAWDDLATVLQRCLNPPPVRGTTPPPPVVVTRPLVTMPTIAPQSIHVITDTSVVSLILDGNTIITNPPRFYGQFPGLRQVVGDVGTANLMLVPKIRSVLAYNWYRTRSNRSPAMTVSITKTVHSELMNAPQVRLFTCICCTIIDTIDFLNGIENCSCEQYICIHDGCALRIMIELCIGIFNPRRMREGYGSHSLCVCVCLSSRLLLHTWFIPGLYNVGKGIKLER